MTQRADLLTSPQAGLLLGKSARTIQRMADAGELPFVMKLPGPNGAFLFDPQVIEDFAAKAKAAKTDEPSTGTEVAS